MFVEMKKQRLEFSCGKVRLWLRFDIKAFYIIEDSGYSPFDILSQSSDPKAVRCFLENGLRDWHNSEEDFYDISEYINLLMGDDSFRIELLALIQQAIILALPKAKIGNKRDMQGGSSILGLMTAFCDIMGGSKEEFMDSTVREAAERWERYAIAKGYKKPAEKFSRYEDDAE